MADRVWISASNGNWNDTANWSGGAVPVSNDRVFFRTVSSTVSPDTNINSQDAVDLDLLHIEKDWPGNIGAVGNYLEISADMVIHEGAGTLYYSDGSGTTDEFILNARHASGGYSAVIGNGSANTYTFFNAVRGRFQAATGTVFTKLVIGYANNPAQDVYVVGDATLGTIVDYQQYAGYAEINAAITRGVLIGGTFKYQSGALALLDQFNGTTIFNSTSTSAEVNLHGGSFDMTQNGQAKTVTLLRKGPNGRLAYDGGVLHTVTVRQVGSGASMK